MSTSKTKKPFKGNIQESLPYERQAKDFYKKPIKGQNSTPMNDSEFQSIMEEYLISPLERMKNPRIQRAVSLNDSTMLKKVLESDY